ncbi:MAG: hypothetical protein AAF752_12290 [Bacteroidota bacterium]
MLIYELRNPETGKSFYVGKAAIQTDSMRAAEVMLQHVVDSIHWQTNVLFEGRVLAVCADDEADRIMQHFVQRWHKQSMAMLDMGEGNGLLTGMDSMGEA